MNLSDLSTDAKEKQKFLETVDTTQLTTDLEVVHGMALNKAILAQNKVEFLLELYSELHYWYEELLSYSLPFKNGNDTERDEDAFDEPLSNS